MIYTLELWMPHFLVKKLRKFYLRNVFLSFSKEYITSAKNTEFYSDLRSEGTFQEKAPITIILERMFFPEKSQVPGKDSFLDLIFSRCTLKKIIFRS
jgi:hypothetical protein